MSTFLPAPAPAVTAIPGVVQTIVVQTAGAAQTQTARVLPPTATPTWTPLPTKTASVTPSPTPTFIWRLGNPTTSKGSGSSTPGGDKFACDLVSQNPDDGKHYAPKQNFNVSWRMKNTGTAKWLADAVDFAYLSGTKLHKVQVYDLPDDIPVGQSVTMTVSMKAPVNKGTYTTVWTLRRGQNDFCHVNLRIIVP